MAENKPHKEVRGTHSEKPRKSGQMLLTLLNPSKENDLIKITFYWIIWTVLCKLKFMATILEENNERGLDRKSVV